MYQINTYTLNLRSVRYQLCLNRAGAGCRGGRGPQKGVMVLKGSGSSKSNSGICLKASLSKISIVDCCNNYLNSKTVELGLKSDWQWTLQRNLPLSIIIAKLFP